MFLHGFHDFREAVQLHLHRVDPGRAHGFAREVSLEGALGHFRARHPVSDQCFDAFSCFFHVLLMFLGALPTSPKAEAVGGRA